LAELEPVSSQTWLDLVHPEDTPRSRRALQRHFDGETPLYSCECRVRHKDGHWVWVLDRGRVVTSTEDGRPLKMFGTHTDISERILAEEALRESEEKHRKLFETIAQAVVYYDGAGEVVAANPAVQNLLGLTIDEWRGKVYLGSEWRFIREDGSTLPADERPLAVTLRTGKSVERYVMGVKSPTKDDFMWLSVTDTPLFRQGESRPFLVCSTFEDITDRKNAEG
jgi:PAS domain S-box-containing protein